jgi:hypothetical protein
VKIISPHKANCNLSFFSNKTPDFTFGGGIKTFSSTVKDILHHKACTKTDKIPYALVPFFSQMRCATSF